MFFILIHSIIKQIKKQNTMKKALLIISLITFSLGMFAQSTIQRNEGLINQKTDYRAEPSVAITVGTVTTSTIEAIFTPNAECDSFFVLISTAASMDQFVTMMGQPLENLVQMWGLHCKGNFTHVWNQLEPNTEQTIYALPKNAAGVNSTLQTLLCTTEQLGGTGLSTLTIDVSDIVTTQARVIVTPNAETSVYHYGLITIDYYNTIGADSAVNYFKADPYPLYTIDNWIWSDLTPNTTYKVVAIGQNSANEWGTPKIVEFTTLNGTGVSTVLKNSAIASISPNPNNGKFNIELNSSEVAEVQIFDLNGRVVYKQNINNALQSVNVEHLDNGCYFVQLISNSGVRQQVQKIVISK